MDLSIIKEEIKSYLEKENLSLYDLVYEREGEDYFLRVFVDNEDYNISLEDLAKANEAIGAILDKYDKELPPYYLEVSSPGAEREIRGDKEILKAVNSYVHVEFEDKIYEGYLLSYENHELTVKVNFKGRMKNINIKQEDLKFIRYAVKI